MFQKISFLVWSFKSMLTCCAHFQTTVLKLNSNISKIKFLHCKFCSSQLELDS